MRKLLRSIARARMEALGVEKINHKMHYAWRRVIGTGDLSDVAERAQMKPAKKARRAS